MENWYDLLSNDFVGMSESELRKKVAEDVQKIQDDNHPLSFVIPKDFVESWTKWVEYGSLKGGPKPGAIDNRALKK